MNNIKKIILESKIMGSLFYVPFIMMILVGLYSFLIRTNHMAETYIVSIYENIIPLFASWWGIYILCDLLEEEGGEVLFTYGKNYFKIGILNNIKYFILYIILFSIVMVLGMHLSMGFISEQLLIQIIFQSLFYCAFGFFTMILIKDSGWSIFVQISYFCINYFTQGKLFPKLSIYLFNVRVPDNESVVSNSIKCIIFSITFFVVGQILLNKYKSGTNTNRKSM